ncbi:MAG: hypothetical protein ACKVY0_12715 [Prosthecobacter sp.]|uniref:hypothetical protein n=1 Tax=Prosthecobacter sp. TaxID=1965333 RepID=UPI0038FE6F56
MKPPLSCPACQSTNTEVAPEQPKTTFFSFRVVLEHRCADCGHPWEPHAPWWLLITGVLAGLAVLALGIVLFSDRKSYFVATVASLAGCIALRGSIVRMVRKWQQR